MLRPQRRYHVTTSRRLRTTVLSLGRLRAAEAAAVHSDCPSALSLQASRKAPGLQEPRPSHLRGLSAPGLIVNHLWAATEGKLSSPGLGLLGSPCLVGLRTQVGECPGCLLGADNGDLHTAAHSCQPSMKKGRQMPRAGHRSDARGSRGRGEGVGAVQDGDPGRRER